MLRIVSLDEIAAAWCAYVRVDYAQRAAGGAPNEPEWWAVEFVLTLLPPVRCLQRDLLVALVSHAAGDGHVLDAIGAGPFEDVLAFDDDTVTWIESQAAESEPFRAALRAMNLPHRLSDDLRLRVNRAAGVPRERWLKFRP